MSHEIRTPMNAIIGMIFLLSKTTLNQTQKHYLEKIQNNTNLLLGIVNDILDFSKIEAGKLSIEKTIFDLKEVMEQVLSINTLKAKEKNLSIKTNYDSLLGRYFIGDNLRISQILNNLISNAIKFTDKGTITLNIKPSLNNKIRFEVIDTGIGLTKEQQNKLFQAFVQADGSITRKYGGTGLGLAISKQLVQLMGGSIWVQSTYNKGSKFSFEIELQQTDETPIKTEEDVDTTPLENSWILLTEDNATNQEIIIDLLQEQNINIEVANNGKEAVDIINKNPNKFDAILMDIQMPIMDGYQAAKLIKKINPKVPIISLTANVMKEDIQKAYEAGMVEHISKPIDMKKLYKVLLKYIKNSNIKTFSTSKKQQNYIFPEFKYINKKIGLSFLDNDEKIYEKILKNFYETYKNLDIKTLNSDETKKILHVIRGLSENIGALSLHRAIKELEEDINENNINTFEQELKKVIQELSYLEKSTDIHLSSNLTSSLAQKEIRDRLFEELINSATLKKPKECSAVIEKIKQYTFVAEDREKLEKAIKSINKYRFDEAIKILKES